MINKLAFVLALFLSASAAVAQPIVGALPSSQPPGSGYSSPDQRPAGGKFLNLSTRGWIDGNSKVMIAGLVVGTGNRIVLVRAVGPSLASFGVTDALAKPVIELRDAKGTVIATSMAWGQLGDADKATLRNTSQTVGAFALKENSDDAVLFAYLEAGLYTCVVSGAQGTSGEAMVEAYDVPAAPPPGGVTPDTGNAGS